jgi:hypothetical protein
MRQQHQIHRGDVKRRVAIVLVGVLGIGLAGCPNPVQDREIEALGGECSDIPESEYHRPGQPCVLCHGQYEKDSPRMSIAGTIFATKSSATPVEGAEILLTDANGSSPPGPVLTNCIGNFFIEDDAWTPAFPIHAEIVCPNPDDMDEPRRLVMGTRISRDGSCAGCHIDKPGDHLDSPGWIYCAVRSPETPYTVRDTCQGRSQDPACPTSGF